MPEIRIKIDSYEPQLNKNENKLNRVLYGKSSAVKQFRTWCIFLIRGTLGHAGIKFNPEPKEKLDVTLIVYRPRPNVDPQNFGDEFWDIISEAIGVNDKHFRTHTDAVDGEIPHFEIILSGE